MDNSPIPLDRESVFRERLQQAKRVMLGLSEQQRVNNFNIRVCAIQSEHGIVACIAGHCGLDLWFQQRGFITNVGWSMGNISEPLMDFFGTEAPFYSWHYKTGRPVTVEDALDALDRAIASFSSDPSEEVAV